MVSSSPGDGSHCPSLQCIGSNQEWSGTATRGRRPISEAKAEEIRRTFKRTGSQSVTARLCNVHRHTVIKLLKAADQVREAADSQGEVFLNSGEQQVLAQRCKICGHTICVLPCRICAAKAKEAIDRFRKLQRRVAAYSDLPAEQRKSHKRMPREQAEARKRRLAAVHQDTAQGLAKRGLSKDDMFGDPFRDDQPHELQLQLFEAELERLREIQGLNNHSPLDSSPE